MSFFRNFFEVAFYFTFLNCRLVMVFCSHLCSKKNPSCLRSPSKENILKFSKEGLNKELKERAPLTFATLVAASTNP